MADVFVSYARPDRDRVAPLVEALEAQGLSVWWDPAITPGAEFDTMIAAELDAARAVIVVWTKTSVDSRWVKGEAREAADRGVLVPVKLEDARLPIDIRAIHTINLEGWGGDSNGAAFKSLYGALEGKLKLSAPKPAPAAAEKRQAVGVCVLPFANMSGDPEQDYFADGVTEDIITDLSKVGALSIVSRNTAFSFKGKVVDVKQVAKQTNASHVLEGSVRKAGNRLRITAQLIDAANDAHVWAERYDRDLNDIFALQDEIAKAVVAALKLTLLPEEKQALEHRSTKNPEAYKLYLMARQFWLLDNERNNEVVIRICQHVVQLDPNYAQAWATMALAQWNLFWRADIQYQDLETPAARALELDPNLADAHAAMAAAHRSQGRFEEGLAYCMSALKLEPQSYVANRLAGLCCIGLRRFDDAIAYFETAANAMESDFTAAAFVTQCYEAKGDKPRILESAKRAMGRVEKIVAAEPGHSRAIGIGVGMLVTLNERERAMEWTTRARLVDPENVNLHYNLACAMSVMGETEEALKTLEGVALRISPGMLSWIDADSDLDAVRNEPRFVAMMAEARARLAGGAAAPKPAKRAKKAAVEEQG